MVLFSDWCMDNPICRKASLLLDLNYCLLLRSETECCIRKMLGRVLFSFLSCFLFAVSSRTRVRLRRRHKRRNRQIFAADGFARSPERIDGARQ